MIYKKKIEYSQANYDMVLIKSGGAQGSYYITEFYNNALDKNVIYQTEVEGYPGNNRASDKKYVLSEDYTFELGSKVLDLIGEEYKNNNNKFIISYPQTKTPKPQLNRNVYNKLAKNDKGYEWFVKLYDNNITENTLLLDIDEENRKLILDISFTAFQEYLSSDDPSKLPFKNKDYPHNRIVFGAPGTGKSFRLKEDSKIFEDRYERVTFHPNYSYSQFVGTYKPVPVKDDESKTNEITYKYVPGPFMRVYVKAMKSDKPYLLLIEEINRANVTSVFGDVFQLLDRENGESEYPIETSADMRDYLEGAEITKKGFNPEIIKIPKNMYIWASMNSADQGVFPMDTAFKRRWEFEYIGINDNSEEIEDITVGLGKDQHVIKWNNLRTAINNKLSDKYKINEDKLLGPYFLSKEILDTKESDTETREWESKQINVKDNDKFLKAFKSKVLMYLFEDVTKQYGPGLFEGCKDPNKYSSICNEFDEKGEAIFGDDFIEKYADDNS